MNVTEVIWPTYPPKNGNPGIVPPWLLRPIPKPVPVQDYSFVILPVPGPNPAILGVELLG